MVLERHRLHFFEDVSELFWLEHARQESQRAENHGFEGFVFLRCDVPHLRQVRLVDAPARVQEIKQVETLLDDFRMETAREEDIKNVVVLYPFHQSVPVQPLVGLVLLQLFLHLEHLHYQQGSAHQLLFKHGHLETSERKVQVH